MRTLLLIYCLMSCLKAADKPNFIIIIADDVSAEDIGCYGNKFIRTPNLDKMADEGLRFNNAFLTISSCSPSRCSIMTGLYPHSTGAGSLHEPLPENKTTIAGYLKPAGYYSASAGKWHLGDNIKGQFDKIAGGKDSGCEEWVKCLKDRPKDKPFFMWFASYDAHRGWSATEGKSAISKPHTNEEVYIPPYYPDTPEVRRDFAQYYDEISRLDDYTGQVIEELKKQQIYENTVIIFMADNGRPFPRAKTRVIDSGIKTPFLVHWAGSRQNSVNRDELVSSIDILPTFLEMAGLPVPNNIHGRSFAKMFVDPTAITRKYVYAEHNWHDYKAHERMVRSKEFLYVRNAFPELSANPPADAVRSDTFQTMVKLNREGKLSELQTDCFITPRETEEFYNSEKDKFQFKNLIHEPEYKEKLKDLSAALDQWIKETEDKIPDSPKEDTFDRLTGKKLKK